MAVPCLRLASAAILACLCLALCSGAAHADPSVTSVRLGVDSQRTRVVLDLSEPLKAQAYLVTAPDRLVIDLPPVDWQAPRSATSGLGLVKGYRYGEIDSKTSRLVFDLSGPAKIVSKFSLLPGSGYKDRFVVDLSATDPIAQTLAENQPETGTPPELRVPAPQHKPRRLTTTVIVDPGHGGVDPGTIGVDGTQEKDVVLAVGLKLRDDLKKAGYNVVMTRDDDTYLTLDSRVEVARGAKADLFISLHADSNSEADLRGASVYTLSDKASDAATAELAKKENGADTIGGIDISAESADVSSILIDLTMRETMNQSARFARLLLPQLGEVAPLLKNTHRYAGFKVLKAPDVPSVLVELGQLSNTTDADRLTDDKVQARMAGAICRAVNAYFSLDQQRAERGEMR